MSLPIYFYNRLTGTRWLTCGESHMGKLDPASSWLGTCRRLPNIPSATTGWPAGSGFFAADPRRFGPKYLRRVYEQIPREQVWSEFELSDPFQLAVPEPFHQDDLAIRPGPRGWFRRYSWKATKPKRNRFSAGSARVLLQVEWLAGGRFEEGEFLLDSVFAEAVCHPEDPELQRMCDPRAKDIIYNFLRDYGDLEYIGYDRITPEWLSLDRPQREGRRSVFLARSFPGRLRRSGVSCGSRSGAFGSIWRKAKACCKPSRRARNIRITGWTGRLGCRQFGMNLCHRFFMRRFNGNVRGKNEGSAGRPSAQLTLNGGYFGYCH